MGKIKFFLNRSVFKFASAKFDETKNLFLGKIDKIGL